MVQRTQIVLEDDLTGGEADETVTFALDGVTYELDLNADNAAQMRDALAPYVGVARKADGKAAKPARSRSGSSTSSVDRTAMRAWARQNGWPNISERGRVSQEIQDAYAAAGSPAAA